MYHCRAVRSVHDNQFECVSGLVRAENEIAGRVLADFLDNDCVAYRVLDVLGINSVPKGRTKNIHPRIVLRNLSRWELRAQLATKVQCAKFSGRNTAVRRARVA